MCEKNGEEVDHLSLLCDVARALWNNFFGREGLVWVMPRRVVDLLASWRGLCGSPQIATTGKMAPICLPWCI